jgi:hypothetical protein
VAIFANHFFGARLVRSGNRPILELYVPVATGRRWQKFSVYLDDALLGFVGECFTGRFFFECEDAEDLDWKKTLPAEEVPDEIIREFKACDD